MTSYFYTSNIYEIQAEGSQAWGYKERPSFKKKNKFSK